MFRAQPAEPELPEEVAVETSSLSKLYSHSIARLVESPISLTDRLIGRRTADVEGDEDDEAVPDELESDAEPEPDAGYEPDEVPRTVDVTWGLRDVSLRLDRGHAVAVVGPPASGKTTLLNVLGGTTPPTSGRALTRGLVWPPPGYLTRFMDGSVTARQNVQLAAKAANLSKRATGPVVDEALELVGWPPSKAMRPAGRSVRAIALATGLALRADVLLVDAPAAFGDSEFSQRCVERFRELRDEGSLVLLEAPSEELLDAVCDQLLWLADGRLAGLGPTAELLPAYLGSGADESAQAEGDEPALRGFTASVALLGARAESEAGEQLEAYPAAEPLAVRVLLEVAEAPVQVRCTLALADQESDEVVRVEQDQPAGIASTGFHDLEALLPPGRVPPGDYLCRVELAVTAGADEATIGRTNAFRAAVRGRRRAEKEAATVEWTVTHRLESPL